MPVAISRGIVRGTRGAGCALLDTGQRTARIRAALIVQPVQNPTLSGTEAAGSTHAPFSNQILLQCQQRNCDQQIPTPESHTYEISQFLAPHYHLRYSVLTHRQLALRRTPKWQYHRSDSRAITKVAASLKTACVSPKWLPFPTV
jgi:hypothetical protein